MIEAEEEATLNAVVQSTVTPLPVIELPATFTAIPPVGLRSPPGPPAAVTHNLKGLATR